MQSRIVIVAASAAVAGAALMWIVAPDVGGGPSVERPVVREAPVQRPVPAGPVVHTEPGEPAPEVPAAPAQRSIPRPPAQARMSREVVQEATMQGLATAAALRREDAIACWEEHIAVHGESSTRFTLEIGIGTDDDDQAFTVRIPAAEPGAEELDACLAEVFADARFAPLDGPGLRLLWPVPMPRN